MLEYLLFFIDTHDRSAEELHTDNLSTSPALLLSYREIRYITHINTSTLTSIFFQFLVCEQSSGSRLKRWLFNVIDHCEGLNSTAASSITNTSLHFQLKNTPVTYSQSFFKLYFQESKINISAGNLGTESTSTIMPNTMEPSILPDVSRWYF